MNKTKFLCPNCSVISEISKIEIDDVKRDKAKDIQKEIEGLESDIKKEENRWFARKYYIGCLRMDILDKTIRKVECETKYKYIECPVCKRRHYIDDK